MRCNAVLAVLLAAGALAGPSGQRTEHRCAAYCLTSPSSKFSHTPGQTYQYSYRSTVRTTLSDATDEISGLEVAAQADIVANSACDFTLWLREVTLKESDPTNVDNTRPVDDMNSFKSELETHPLSFSYQDGRVEELCATQTESVWALNFKRGLLSAIVNNMVSFQQNEYDKYEMDVSGYCSTGYTLLSSEDNSTVIVKTKDLRTCRERGRLISSLQTTPYHSASKIQSLPLLQSTQQCRQTVSDGRIRSLLCTEDHLFQPFSRNNGGARTSVTLELTETGVMPSQPSRGQGALTARGNIMFDHSTPTLTAQSRVGDIQRLVSELDDLSAGDVRPQTPRLFSQLVASLRHVEADDLLELLTDAAGRPRHYVLDALPMLGTAAGMTAMRQLVLNKNITSDQADRWMTSLALVQEPSLVMVEALVPLVAAENVRSQTLLGVTALVHHFCKRDTDCKRHEAVAQVVRSIENLLGSDCSFVTHEERGRILAALKALGNMGLLVQGNTILKSCHRNHGDVEVRLAAIRAYRRMSCGEIADSGLMATLADMQENTEVRIAAYLAIMQCPGQEVVDKLLELLEKETLNQVGSFIWTHITNLQESNDPGKDYVKSLLFNAELSKKFNTDARKFSRYYEKTLFFESVNAGGTVEGSVIFSPDSYLPRSGMLNLTVDLFGDSINLMEVGARIEGLEHRIESLLTNGGSYQQTALNKVLNTITGSDSSLDINRLSNTYNQANVNADLFRASAYAKIFGNELHFADYDNLDDLIRSLQGDDPLSFFKTLGQERDWSENYQFLDSSYTVPTLVGFPLKLHAAGSASAIMKTGGTFSFESWSKISAEGYIKPSAAVEIVSGMGVDAHAARTGLKMSANLHTSTVLDGHMVIDSGKLVSFKVNMPRDKVEIFDLKTSFHRVHRNEDRPLASRPNSYVLNEYGDCTDPYIGDPLGIKACFQMSYLLSGETPYNSAGFPFTGPITASLSIEKTDHSIEAFTLEYTHSNQNEVRQSALTFDTPGGARDRRVSLRYMLDVPQKAFHVGLVTPVKSLELSGGLHLTGAEKHANVQLRLDDREVVSVSGSLTTDEYTASRRYRPQLLIRGPAGPVFRLTGSLNMNKDRHKYAVDLIIGDVFDNPVTLTGTVDEADGTYMLTTTMDSYLVKGSLLGAIRYVGNEFEFRTNTRYSIYDGPQHTVAINTRMMKDITGADSVYTATVNTKFSALPALDSELSVQLSRSDHRLGGRVTLLHSQQSYQLSGELASRDGQRSGLVAFRAQHLDVDCKLALQLDTSKKQRFEMTTLAQLKEDHFVRAGLVVDYLSESYDFNYGINSYVTLMNSNYSLGTGVRRNETTSEFTFVASRSSPAERKLISLVSQLATSASGEHTAEATLKLPSYPTTRLAGRLSVGAAGRYLVSAEVQRGARLHLLSAEYRFSDQHELLLRAQMADRQYSGTLAARTEGGNYKLKADLLGQRRVIAVISLRPGEEETNVNFELFWNKDVDDSQNVLIDIQRTSRRITSRLRYPGRDMQLLAELKAGGAVAVLQLSPEEIITVTGTVSFDDEGRLGAILEVQTPFPGYTSMMLKFRNVPDTTDERSFLNFQLAGHIEGQEVVLDGRLVFDFNGLQTIRDAKGNVFKATLDLRTPFDGWERSQLICSYLQDSNELSARLSASRNAETISLGVVFEKLQRREVFRINTAVDFELPVDRVRKGKVGFGLTFRDSKLESDTLVEWTSSKPNQLSMNVQCRYNVTQGVWVSSLVTFKTPFKNMEHLETRLQFRKDKMNLATSIRVLRNETEELFETHLGTITNDVSGLFSGQFELACKGCPSIGALLDYQTNADASSFNVSTRWKENKSELSGVTKYLPDGGKEYSLALLLPNPRRRYLLKNAFHADIAKQIVWNHWEVSRDNQSVKIDLSSAWTMETRADNTSTYAVKGIGKLTSPFLGWESATISHIATLNLSESVVDVSTNLHLQKEDKHIFVNETGQIYGWTSWSFSRDITSNTGWFSAIQQFIKLDISDNTSRKAIFSTNWDSQDAQLALVDALSEDGNYEAFATAQWFGQPERRLSLTMPPTPEAWTPSLTVLYAPGKTVKIYGSIAHASTVSESHLTIESPFTDVLVLKTRHNFRDSAKYVEVKVLYGNDEYEVWADIDTRFPLQASSSVTFSSPSQFFGSAALRMNYLLSDSFVVNWEMSHNGRKVSLTSSFSKREGGVVIITPLPGFTELSLTYRVAPREIQVRLAHEENVSSLVLSDRSESDALKYAAELTTPYRGFELMTLSFVRPSGNSFKMECHHNAQRIALVTGSYELSVPKSNVRIHMQTPFEVIRDARLELSYNLPEPHVKLLLTQTGSVQHKIQLEATASFSVATSTLRANYQNSGLILGPRSLTMTATYDVQDFEKRLNLKLTDGDRIFSVKGIAQLQTRSSHLSIVVDSPIPHYETLSVSGKAVSLPGGPKLTFELVKNSQAIQADLEISKNKYDGKAVFEMNTPFTVNRHVLLSAEYRLQNSIAQLKLVAEKDSTRKTISSSASISYNARDRCQEGMSAAHPDGSWGTNCKELTLDASLTTPFDGMEHIAVKGAAKLVNTTGQAHLALDYGQHQITADVNGRLTWLTSDIAVQINTPFTSVQNIGFNATYDIGSQTKTASLSLLKNEQHFNWMTQVTVQSGEANGQINILTPYQAWKSAKYSASYNLNELEKYMDITYERNGQTQTFATRGSYDGSSISLNALTPFEGFESLGIGGRYVNSRAKREIGYDAHINEDRHRLYVLYERDGQDNVKLRLNTPIHGLHAVEVDLRKQSFSDGVGIYLEMNTDGKRSSGEIRTSLVKTTMGIEVSFKSDWENFEDVGLSGSVNLAKRKKAFRLASRSKKQNIELSGFYALSKKGGVGKLVSKLPIQGLEKVNARVKVITGKKNKLILTYAAGGKKKKINGDLEFTDGGVDISLKTPFQGFQRIRASASRTTQADGKVSAELTLKRENREIAVKYAYVFSLKSGEGNIEISTPYEGFEDMRMSLTYNNRPQERNMKFVAMRNSRGWSIESSRSWTDGTDETSLILSSPIESIRSLKVHRSFDIRNLAAMTYRASYERNNRKFAISGEGSIANAGQQISLDVNVNTPLDIGQLSASIAYDFSVTPRSLNAGITAGNKYMKLAASLGRPSGNIKLTTSLPQMPSIDIDYNAYITDSSRDVSSTVTLADGRSLSIAYKMTVGRDGREGSIKVDSSTFGNRELVWSYSSERRQDRLVRLAVKSSYKSPNAQGNFDISVNEGRSQYQRIVKASFSIVSGPLTKSIELDSSIDFQNFPEGQATATISVDGRPFKLVVNREKQRGMRTLNISFEGTRALQIIGTSSAEVGQLEGERSITVTYGRGQEQSSVTTKVSFGAGGKSGLLEVQAKIVSPSGRAGNRDIRFNTIWSFIQPNRVIESNLSVDGRTYIVKVTGSRSEKMANYVLEATFPGIRVSRRASISDAMVELSYDFRNGINLKVKMDKPFEGSAELSLQKSEAETIINTLFALNDKQDLSPTIDNHRLGVNYRRTKTANGAELQISLDTTALNLGEIDLKANIQRTSSKSTVSIDYKRGRKTAQIIGEISRGQGSGSSTFRLTTPIIGFEDVNLSGGYQYSPGQQYGLNVDYSRGGKHFRLDAASTVSTKKVKGKTKTMSSQSSVTINSLITRPLELSLTADVAINDLGTAKQSLTGKFEGVRNGQKASLTYSVDRDEHGRRTANAVLTTPLKSAYKKIVLSSDVSLHSNRAELSVQAGPRKLAADISWFAGEAGQYGVELSLATPYDVVKTLELEVRGTLNRDRSVDVLVHYQRNGVMGHVSGSVRPYAADLLIEAPSGSSYRMQAGADISRAARQYSVRALITSVSAGWSAGGEVTVKATALNDLQLTLDVQTPLAEWRRFSVVVAYTAVDEPFSRVIRVGFESPQTQRSEVSLQLTNGSGGNRTDLRAGVTLKYQDYGLTFWTHILRDPSGMKYELMLQTPYHIDLPLLAARH